MGLDTAGVSLKSVSEAARIISFTRVGHNAMAARGFRAYVFPTLCGLSLSDFQTVEKDNYNGVVV